MQAGANTHGHGEIAKASLLTEEERQQSVVITDPSLPGNPIIFASDEFEAQTGYPPEETLGRNCKFLQGPDTDPNDVEAIRQALRTHSELTVDILNYKKDGTPFLNRLRIRPIRDAKGKVLYYAGAQNPIAPDEALPHPVKAVFD